MPIHLPNHVTLTWFAREKQVYPLEIQLAIKKRLIEADAVGREGLPMIDYSRYEHVQFKHILALSPAEKVHHLQALNRFYDDIVPHYGNPRLTEGMVFLPSVSTLLDVQLSLYPVRIEHPTTYRLTSPIPSKEVDGQWFDALSSQDLETIERLKKKKSDAVFPDGKKP